MKAKLLISLAAALLLGCVACFVDGKEILGPWDGQYYVDVCVDSTVTDTDRVCYGVATVSITIPNPLYTPQDTVPKP